MNMVARGYGRRRPTPRTLLLHLRLPFQLLLAPIFLWGWLLGGGGLSSRAALAFIAFHVFLYGGVTAFNSYYDRDQGPVGGMEHPPPVVPALLPFSWLVQLLGWAVVAALGLDLAVVYGAFVALSFVYSHPSVRWKARPILSLALVGLGQGGLGFLAGWLVAESRAFHVVDALGLLGGVSSVLLILGLFPLTQIYQVEEDRSRGDRTVAVAWGPRASFRLALAFYLVGGAAMVAALALRFGPVDAAAGALALAAQAAVLLRWAPRFDVSDVPGNYRRVMRFNTTVAVVLASYLAFRLLAG